MKLQRVGGGEGRKGGEEEGRGGGVAAAGGGQGCLGLGWQPAAGPRGAGSRATDSRGGEGREGEEKGREGMRGKRRNPAGTAKDKELHSMWEQRRGVQIRARAAGGPQESATT